MNENFNDPAAAPLADATSAKVFLQTLTTYQALSPDAKKWVGQQLDQRFAQIQQGLANPLTAGEAAIGCAALRGISADDEFRARRVAAGDVIDRSKWAPAYRERLEKLGVTDAQIREHARKFADGMGKAHTSDDEALRDYLGSIERMSGDAGLPPVERIVYGDAG